MLVSTEVGTGEIVSEHANTHFYDDLTCLAADWRAHEGDDATAFIRLERGWSDARAAWYAQPADARTPMGSGLAAFATQAEARAADRDGRALRWEDVLKLSGGR